MLLASRNRVMAAIASACGALLTRARFGGALLLPEAWGRFVPCRLGATVLVTLCVSFVRFAAGNKVCSLALAM